MRLTLFAKPREIVGSCLEEAPWSWNSLGDCTNSLKKEPDWSNTLSTRLATPWK